MENHKKILTVTLNPAIDVRYNIEGFETDEVNRTSFIEKNAGGKGINVTRILEKLGANVIATGLVGGFSGKLFLSKLKELDITADFLETNVETRTCIAIIDKNNREITEILEGNEQSPDTFESFLLKFDKLLSEDIEYVCLSGSLPKKMNSNAYNILLDKINMLGKKAILDTSGDSLVNALKSKPYLIKPNRDEIEYIFKNSLKTEEDIIDSGKKLIEMGATNVVISLGGDGAILVTKENSYRYKAPKIEVKNSVGSGDAMIGGITFSLSQSNSIDKAVEFGILCGSVNASLEKTGDLDLAILDNFKRK